MSKAVLAFFFTAILLRAQAKPAAAPPPAKPAAAPVKPLPVPATTPPAKPGATTPAATQTPVAATPTPANPTTAATTTPGTATPTSPPQPKAPPPPLGGEVITKTFDVRFVNPERIRDIFSARSVIMQANHSLKTLTVIGSPTFVKEVEDTIARYDLPPDPPSNIQITVYLLTVSAQAPKGIKIPAELATIAKEFGTTAPKLADSQILRIRESQPGDAYGQASAPDAASLFRVHVQSAFLTPGKKGDLVSLNGLRIWLTMPVPAGTTPAPAKTIDPDITADLDLDQSQPALVSKVGLDQPIVIAVRATVVP